MKSKELTNQSVTFFSTKQMVLVSLLSALAYILMLLHLPYKFLGFMEFEFSDIPAVIAALQFGPLAGVAVEFIKNLVKAITGTTTGFVGELANFLICSSYIIPVGLMYKIRNSKLRKSPENVDKAKRGINLYMLLTFSIATMTMTITGALLNYFVMLPLYAKLFGGMNAIVGAASAYISAINNLWTLVIIGISPFNVAKGIMISVIGYYTFKLLKRRLF